MPHYMEERLGERGLQGRMQARKELFPATFLCLLFWNCWKTKYGFGLVYLKAANFLLTYPSATIIF